MEKVTLKVEGMACEHCKKAVADAVGGLSTAKDINVDLKAGTVTLAYDSGSLSLSEIGAAIEEAGYSCKV
ncbi:MAG: cation transporter [Treponema sp.]|jgi:copper chaperone|nr:cation transporter [Treponema sp.]